MLDGSALALRHAARPAPARPFVGEPAQVARRGLPRRHQLAGILVAQLVEREGAPERELHGCLEQLARIQSRESRSLAQIALAVPVELEPRFCDRHFQADRGQGVLQSSPRAHVHVNVAARKERHRVVGAELLEGGEALAIASLAQQLDRDPQPPGEALGEPAQLGGRGLCRRHPQDVALCEACCLEVGARERVSSLVGRAPAAGDEAAQPSVAAPVDGERDQREAALEAELRADDELQAAVLRRHVRAHDAGNRALVGDREGGIAECVRLLHQLVGMRGAAQEGEVGEAVQLGVRRQRRRSGNFPRRFRRK